jgi:hypothetical protein
MRNRYVLDRVIELFESSTGVVSGEQIEQAAWGKGRGPKDPNRIHNLMNRVREVLDVASTTHFRVRRADEQ